MKRFFKISLNTFGVLVLAILLLSAMGYYIFQWSEFQTSLSHRAAKWLTEEVGAEVSVGRVSINWFDEISIEDVNIKDLQLRDMIYVREVYINFKSNLDFGGEKFIEFDNNLDFIMLKEPDVRAVREKDGSLNVDRWLQKVQSLVPKKKNKKSKAVPFTIDEAIIQDGIFRLVDDSKKPFPAKSFDYYNFKFEKIQANIKDLYLKRDTIIFEANKIMGYDPHSKMVIHEINTDFFYSKNQMLLQHLEAKINNSVLKDFIGFYYKKPGDFNRFNDKVKIKARLNNSEIDTQDLGMFSSVMYKYKDRYTISSQIAGTVKDLNIEQTKIGFGKSSFLNLKGNFKHLPDLLAAAFDLQLLPSFIKPQDARQYAGELAYKKYAQKVGDLSLSGNFKGTFDDFYTDADIQSALLGKAKGHLNFSINPQTQLAEYDGELDAQEVDLAQITGRSDLFKKAAFSGKVTGTGLDLKTAALRLDGSVKHIWVKNYNYQNIRVDGELGKAVFDGNIAIDDPNLQGVLDGHIDLSDTQNEFLIDGQIIGANLKKLGYTSDEVKVQTLFSFDFSGNKLDDFLGNARLENTFLNINEQNLVIDELDFTVDQFGQERQMRLVSEFFDASIVGGFLPTQLMADLKKMYNEYKLYFVGNQEEQMAYYSKKETSDNLMPYTARYEVKIKDVQNFFDFYDPTIGIAEGSVINGDIRIQNTSQFTFYAQSDTLIFKGNAFYNSEIDFYSSKDAFSPDVLTSLVVFSDEQKLANNVNTEQLEINGSWGDARTIDFDGAIKQKNTNNRAQLFGNLHFDPKSYTLKINPRNSRLDLLDNRWTFNKDNSIVFEANEVIFNDFAISNKNQGLSVDGYLSADSTKDLRLYVTDFDLRTLKPLYDLDLEGTANGQLKMQAYYGNPIITSQLNIDELVYKNILVGTLSAEALWDNTLKKLGIASSINRLNDEVFRLSGTYDPSATREALNLTAQLRKTNLEVFGTFIESIISDLGGYADGILRINGMPKDPTIRGEVAIEKGRLKLNATGGYLYFDDKIIFNEEGFVTKPGGISLRDAPENGNVATLEGGIFNGGGGNFMMGLHAYIKDRDGFKLMSLNASDNDVFYGTAYAGGDIHLTGSFNNVLISGNLSSKRNTKITIPLDGATSVDIQEEAIPFKFKITDTTAQKSTEKTTKINVNGVKVALNLTLTPEAECEIIFDRANNDKLSAFGNGRLSIVYDTRGGFSLSGPYVVSSGKYDFSFQNLASLRKFSIIEGSRITWSGDPYKAVLNMKAGYTTNVSLSEIPNINNSQNASELASRYPVNVVVSLTDQLETPTIAYELDFVDNQIPLSIQPAVLAFEQRLKNDEQLLSRNVSSILAFGQVFPENNALDAFRQQFLIDNLNNMLSNQIGNLANKLDPNLEINVLLGDYRQSLLNNLQLNFSYKFLNNRFKLSGKSSYSNGDLTTNPAATLNQGQLTVGGELEYILSEDGVWRLKGYYRSVPNANYYLNTSGGNVIVSGVNVLFSRNFNSLLPVGKTVELFKKNNKFPIGVGKKEDEEEVSFVPKRSTNK